jgi:hypothetical protein
MMMNYFRKKNNECIPQLESETRTDSEGVHTTVEKIILNTLCKEMAKLFALKQMSRIMKPVIR